MTDEQRDAIKAAAERAYAAEQLFKSLGAMNVPSDPVQAMQARVQYALAEAEMLKAQSVLRQAQEPR